MSDKGSTAVPRREDRSRPGIDRPVRRCRHLRHATVRVAFGVFRAGRRHAAGGARRSRHAADARGRKRRFCGRHAPPDPLGGACSRRRRQGDRRAGGVGARGFGGRRADPARRPGRAGERWPKPRRRCARRGRPIERFQQLEDSNAAAEAQLQQSRAAFRRAEAAMMTARRLSRIARSLRRFQARSGSSIPNRARFSTRARR